MGIGKSCGVLCVVFWAVVLFAGCSSSGGGGNDPAPSGDETYTTPGSDLVLRIPDTLNVSQKVVEEIHFNADKVPHCYVTNREFIDIVLAETCVHYDDLYLFPQYFPQGLDNITTVKAYVEYLETNDPFTYYFSPEDFAYIMTFLYGESASIGFDLEFDGLTITDQTPLIISDIDPFTRAWIDGFQIGDKIIEIDGISIEGMDRFMVGSLFPTDEEEAVEITVDRNGTEITIYTANEEHIGLLLYQDIIYLSARSFTRITEQAIRLDFNELQEEAGGSVDKLILDLRGNGGGSLSATMALVDYLIDNDNGTYPIMIASGPAYDAETRYLGDYNEINIGDFDKTNFVLLIDGNSASSSEIVAAALKHYGTATLIGEPTLGKGVGQSIVELIDGSGVFIPAFVTLSPSGESYQGIGVLPDYHLTAQAYSFDDDPVLDAAVEFLKRGDIAIASSSQILREKRINLSENNIDPLKEKLLKMNRTGGSF